MIKGWGTDDVSMDGCRQGREGEGKRSKHGEGQGEAHNGRPRAESPSGVAADTLTVAFHAADSLSGSFFWGEADGRVASPFFKFSNPIYIIEHADTLFIVQVENADRLC